jgi:hypothetical protein
MSANVKDALLLAVVIAFLTALFLWRRPPVIYYNPTPLNVGRR